MRVLVLGATGMLGHKTCQVLASEVDVWATTRTHHSSLSSMLALPENQVLVVPDLTKTQVRDDLFARVSPDVVINCVGVVKQSDQMNDPAMTIEVNSVLPNALAALSDAYGARLIHISTDCVFSGESGMYKEGDFPDALDLYGRTKLLGEPSSEGALVLRTSIIGEEIHGSHGLVAWFLSQSSPIPGYANAYFSGLPTVVLAEAIRHLILDRPSMRGMYHVASERISKLDLLRLLNEAYNRNCALEVTAQPVIDRSLNGSRFASDAGIMFANWPELVNQLVADPWRTRTKALTA